MSTASHNWSKVLMGERSHPPCEGWQGNVAGVNGFSQSAETEGRSLGAALHCPFTPTLPAFPVGAEMWRHSLCLSVCFVWCCQHRSKEARVLDYYFGPFLLGWIDADTLAYSCTQVFPLASASAAEIKERGQA